jgi:hypothetical protein
MEIPNIQQLIADWEILPQLVEEKDLHPELIFGDGGINLPRFADFPGALPQTVYVLHDFSASDQRKSPAWNQWMVLNTSCFLGITSRDSKIFPPLYNVVSLLISPERINMERYRGKNDREEALVETSYGDLKLRY